MGIQLSCSNRQQVTGKLRKGSPSRKAEGIGRIDSRSANVRQHNRVQQIRVTARLPIVRSTRPNPSPYGPGYLTKVSPMNLELYQYYTRDQVAAAFQKLRPTKADGWFLSSQGLVGMFAIGERPPEIHFCDSKNFHWYSRKNETIPKPIQDFNKQKGGHLFIKSPTADRYAYVAQIAHVGMQGGKPNNYQAIMDITPQIPTTLLHELGGLYVHPDGDSALNGPVAALRAARTPVKRLAAFQAFVEAWRGPIEDSHALSDADIAKAKLPIPKILEKLYRWAGACDDIMSAGYLAIRRPKELVVDKHGFVAFCVECQWCGNYYIRKESLQDVDPEIFADECGDVRDGDGHHATGTCLSQFLWGYYIAFNYSGGPLSYQVRLKADDFRRIKKTLDPLPVLASGSQSCLAVQAYRSKIGKNDEALLFAQDGVIAYATQDKDYSMLYLRSKSQPAIDKFVALLKIDPKRLEESY